MRACCLEYTHCSAPNRKEITYMPIDSVPTCFPWLLVKSCHAPLDCIWKEAL